jgi:hypothetical protein
LEGAGPHGGKIVSKNKPYRLSLDFSEDYKARIIDLQKRGRFDTKLELFKEGFAMLNWIIDETSQGHKIIVEADGTQREVVLPTLRK